MKKILNLATLALLAVLLLTGCHWRENPTRTSLEIDTSTMTLAVGESVTRPASTKAKYSYEITYSSSNPAVATVDQNGKVTAVSVGEAIITVHMDETLDSWYAAKTVSYNVVVKNVSAQMAGSISYATTAVNKRTTDAAFTNTLTHTGDGTVSYSSSNTSVATVNASTGEVTIVGAGTATITATVADSDTYSYATKTATYTVTVTNAGTGGLSDYDWNDPVSE